MIIDPLGPPRLHGQGLPHLFQQLLGGFVETDHRISRIIGTAVYVQNLLHMAHEVGAGSPGEAPAQGAPGLQVVFFSVCQTVSWERLSR